MKKKIVIYNCRDCPYSKNEVKYGKLKLLCTNPETINGEIRNPDIIESWCELDKDY